MYSKDIAEDEHALSTSKTKKLSYLFIHSWTHFLKQDLKDNTDGSKPTSVRSYFTQKKKISNRQSLSCFEQAACNAL